MRLRLTGYKEGRPEFEACKEERPTMEENSPSPNLNIFKASGGRTLTDNKPNEEGNQKLQYSIPGILHFIQHEWARFEMERSQWEVDRAELLARIAFLQGERKGQENLKNDLVRRIKMLEYALKQERAKFHKLKYGTDLVQGDMKAPSIDEVPPEVAPDGDAPFSSISSVTWKQGRQLLRQYLQEIGYTEAILDVRSNRVRTLLGLNNNEEGGVNGEGVLRGSGGQADKRRSTPARRPPQMLTEAMVVDTEDAVMANFEFLTNTEGVTNRPDLEDDDQEEDMDEDLYDHDTSQQKNTSFSSRVYSKKQMMFGEGEDLDAEAEEVLNELNLLTQSESSNVINDVILDQKCTDWGGLGGDGGVLGGMKREGDDSALGLGELAQLTVSNDADSTYDLSSSKEAFRKTWSAKYTLRSHFDGVRALAFHPTEAVLVTASEDHTLKLWNLAKTLPAKKSASLDVEPLYTFRGHTGPVLTLAVGPQGDTCYSGGLDGFVHCWTLPSSSMDPYDSYEPGVLDAKLAGHTDAIWRLVAHPLRPQLLSASADGTVKLWSTTKPNHLLNTYSSEQDGVPTSVDFTKDEADKMVCAFSSGQVVLYDLETGRAITRLESAVEVGGGGASGGGVYRVVCHPLLGVSVTAHEDRTIRFLDHTSGKLVHSMVAHLDAVTCLAVDPNALYLLSGSHDCSIRLWNLDNKTCVQEITAHRKKFDESILDVAFHPTNPFIASAGADALAKVFV